MVEKAKEFAKKAHKGQKRKGSDTPYVVHPLSVGEIVSKITSDEEVIAAAILHDTLEDCKCVTRKIISETFSERVAYLVEEETEDKSKTWYERKNATINHLKTAELEVKYIALGDKLSNLRDIDREYDLFGEKIWEKFRMKDKDIIGWYYIGVLNSLSELGDLDEYEEYKQLVEKIFFD